VNELIKHRGPDDDGFIILMLIYIQLEWLCRLSIIDLSSGKQPIKNDDGSIVIVFNGEIYNYKQLKVNLENRGVFLTKSDRSITFV
jgi:asparagine synthase (glutamine-hydrolysing)